MAAPYDFTRVSLLGGPLHQLGRRVGLVRGESNTIALGIAIGWSLWLVLLLLGFFGGIASQLLSLAWISGHVRLLVFIPLLFIFESWLDPQVRAFIRSSVDAGLVPVTERPKLSAHLERLSRWTNAWWPDIACLAVAALFTATGWRTQQYGATVVFDSSQAIFQGTAASELYWAVGPTLFRFLVFRTIWRLGLWWHLLWKVSRLPLRLVPIHPDRAAGLGGLEIVQTACLPLVAGVSAVMAAAHAEEMYRGGISFAAVYPGIATVAGVSLVLVFGPGLLFVPDLLACRQRGFVDYMGLASHYVQDFEQKWLAGRSGEPLLGTADLQSLADLSTSVGIVRDMRLLPASPRLLIGVVVAALAPVLPLWLFQYSLAELIQKAFGGLVGL